MFYIDLILAVLVLAGIVMSRTFLKGGVGIVVLSVLGWVVVNKLHAMGLTVTSVVALGGVGINLLVAMDFPFKEQEAGHTD